VDGKVNYPAACNATETVLVHSKCLFIKEIMEALVKANVTVHACDRSYGFVGHEQVVKATEKDFETEYLDMHVAFKVIRLMKLFNKLSGMGHIILIPSLLKTVVMQTSL
jgi:glutamate-5-semialdehyde dehydrogenase